MEVLLNTLGPRLYQVALVTLDNQFNSDAEGQQSSQFYPKMAFAVQKFVYFTSYLVSHSFCYWYQNWRRLNIASEGLSGQLNFACNKFCCLVLIVTIVAAATVVPTRSRPAINSSFTIYPVFWVPTIPLH
jgi:hypothetical protein